MKVVFAWSHVGMSRHFDGVVRELGARGHDVVLAARAVEKQGINDRAVRTLLKDRSDCRLEPLRGRTDRVLWWMVPRYRSVVDYVNYFRPGHPSPTLRARLQRHLPRGVAPLLEGRALRGLVAGRPVRRILQAAEHIVPADRALVRWLRKERPDVVVASPVVSGTSDEKEYLKAAQALGIPTVAIVASWDNLTTKGTFHVTPDLTLVWNEPLAREAVELHDVPASRILVTGAPTFDFWFALTASTSREEFRATAGIPAGAPYLVYLCSSRSITQDEHAVIAELARALRANPETRRVWLLVRPHPQGASKWDDLSEPNVVVWPRDGELPDSLSAQQRYYDTLAHAFAVIGVNTSAMVEATIVDRPCATILTDRYAATQSGMGHFRLLVAGDYLDVAPEMSAAPALVARLLGGEDARRAQRRRFVREFVRPWGIERPASSIMARAIEGAAARQSARALAAEFTAQAEARAASARFQSSPVAVGRTP